MGPDRNSIKYEIASDMTDPKTELVSPLMKLRLGPCKCFYTISGLGVPVQPYTIDKALRFQIIVSCKNP